MTEMRLASLTIANFQYWDFFELDLTADVDDRPFRSAVLFGDQGSGKSTIARALRWLAYGHLGHARRTLPSAWKGNVLEDQIVRARFIRTTATGPEREILLERRRPAGEHAFRCRIEIKGRGAGVFTDQEADAMWADFVGHPPRAHEGAIWVVRRDEMEKIHKSLTDAEGQGYLLQFFNQAEVIDRIDSVINDLQDEITAFMKAAGRQELLVEQFTRLKEELEEQKAKVEELRIERDEADALVRKNELTEEERQRLENSFKIENLRAKEASYKKEVLEEELGRDDLKDLVSGTLAAILVQQGFKADIPQDTLADEFEWDRILSRVADLLSAESEKALRDLAAAKRGLDVSDIRRALPRLPDMLERMRRLREAKTNLMAVRASLRTFDAHRVTPEIIDDLQLRDEVYRDAVRRAGRLRIEIEESERELNETRERYDEKVQELSEASEAEDNMASRGHALEVAKSFRKALVQAEAAYRSEMFRAALSRLQDFWKRTSTSDVFAPALSSDDSSIVLKRIGSDEEYKILLEDQGQGPSSGESEQLLVCMALALADQARVQMPLILDDVHTRMDNRTRPSVFKIAIDSFDQVLFVTNDENKLEELRPFVEAIVRLRKARLGEAPRSTDVFPDLRNVEEL